MNRRGHIIFALMLLGFGIYMSRDLDYIPQLPFSVILFHIPFYLIGALILDKLESPKWGGRWHRGMLHSRRMFWLTTLVFIPLLIKLTSDSPFQLFADIPYNYPSLGLAVAGGVWTHLVGDSLTSRLPR